MSIQFATGNTTGVPNATKIAADVVGAAAAPAAGDNIQYMKLDLGAAGASSPVSGTVPVTINGTPNVGHASDGFTGGTLAASNSTVHALMTGYRNLGVYCVPGSTFIGTIGVKASFDGGTTYPYICLLQTDPTVAPAPSLAVNGQWGATVLYPAGVSDILLYVVAFTSGTCFADVRQTDAGTAITPVYDVGPIPAGTNLIGKVQEEKINRVAINMFAEAVAGSATEALITMSYSVNFAAVTTGTSYAVTAGKRLRITALLVSWVSTTTTANTCRLRIRVNASGAALVTSPIQFSARIGWESPTFIANESEFQQIDIPEGFEVPGGAGVALTQICAAANGSLDVTLLGYEYTP